MDMLRITDLHKRFGDKEVLKGLNLAVPEHSIFGFIGKNGAGKTTTMKTVLGLIKADTGEITVAGEKVVYSTATIRSGQAGGLPPRSCRTPAGAPYPNCCLMIGRNFKYGAPVLLRDKLSHDGER